jgi:hypothetical protein
MMVQPRPFPGSPFVASCTRRPLTIDEFYTLEPGDEVLILGRPIVFSVLSTDQENFTLEVDPPIFGTITTVDGEILETAET